MKSNIRLFTLFLLFTTSCVILPRQTEAQQTNVSFQVFYDQLSPYGQWIDYSNYGYVWIPDAGADFVPYSTDGHWVLTDYGWTWASDYIWGWATFHYGRWSYADSFGWFWIPDNEWGPAWVNWRQADGYYGWSPMEPGISVSMSFGRSYDSNNDHWLFVRNNDFERTDIHNYYVNSSDRNRIVRNSTVINTTYIDRSRHTTYVSGPTRESVQSATGRTIRPLSIQENNKPGQEINNGQLRIYRPEVDKRNSGQRNAPTKVTDIKDVKRTPARNVSNQNQNQSGTPDNRQVTPPANRVVPQNNNVPQVQQPNRNQQDNNQNRENRTVPAVESQKIRTIEQPRQAPTNVNMPIRRPNNANMQNNAQPVQPVKSTPADNTRPDRQPVVAPQNKPAQPVQNTPVQQRDVTPQNNNQPQQRNVNQQPNNKPVQQNTPAAVQNKPQVRQNQPANKARNNTAPKQRKPVKQQIKVEQAKVPDAVSSERK
jgi:hypothetical protein